MTDTVPPRAEAPVQESYIVGEGKKRGAIREVRPDAAYDVFYKVLAVHGGDAILTDNSHTREVLNHVRKNFAGHSFAMRTLEAWGAVVESDKRAYYTAGGRIWVMDLEPLAGEGKRASATVSGRK